MRKATPKPEIPQDLKPSQVGGPYEVAVNRPGRGSYNWDLEPCFIQPHGFHYTAGGHRYVIWADWMKEEMGKQVVAHIASSGETAVFDASIRGPESFLGTAWAVEVR